MAAPIASLAELDALCAGAGAFEALKRRFPAQWQEVSEAVLGLLAQREPEAIDAHLRKVRAEADRWRARVVRSGDNPKVLRSAVAHLVRARLSALALEQVVAAAATGQSGAVARLSFWDGTIIQRLLFERGLARKAVPLARFRFFWRLVRNKRLLMPLVQPKGIYCFYSRELLDGLRALVGGRPCLEVAAGDGTLSRLLRERGLEVRATDDHSWTHTVTFPDWVEKVDARAALAESAPRAVICSWPPPGNGFERHVFTTPSVEVYAVVGSRHELASGDWESYRRQKDFDWGVDEALSPLVLPPELDGAVLVFRRRSAAR